MRPPRGFCGPLEPSWPTRSILELFFGGFVEPSESNVGLLGQTWGHLRASVEWCSTFAETLLFDCACQSCFSIVVPNFRNVCFRSTVVYFILSGEAHKILEVAQMV
jgi:hypothetical protein